MKGVNEAKQCPQHEKGNWGRAGLAQLMLVGCCDEMLLVGVQCYWLCCLSINNPANVSSAQLVLWVPFSWSRRVWLYMVKLWRRLSRLQFFGFFKLFFFFNCNLVRWKRKTGVFNWWIEGLSFKGLEFTFFLNVMFPFSFPRSSCTSF